MSRGNILILSVQVPFTSGGAEVLVENLRKELIERDFCADIVALPFSAIPKENIIKQIAIWRELDLTSFAGRKVDLVVGTKFPSYLAKHPMKVLWLIHQHRQAYELSGSRFGDFDKEDEAIKQLIYEADYKSLNECVSRFTISHNVSSRLKDYLGIESDVLMPPLPLGERYRSEETENYILSVGRLCSIKRVDLIIRAMPRISPKLKLKVVGAADEPAIENYLKSEVDKHHLWHRVEFLGRVSNEELLKLYSEAFVVCYTPYDEDYGFVTLEALKSKCPVVTTIDSGTVLEFIENEHNGLISQPTEDTLAESINRLVNDRDLYFRLKKGTENLNFTSNWDDIINKITEPILL